MGNSGAWRQMRAAFTVAEEQGSFDRRFKEEVRDSRRFVHRIMSEKGTLRRRGYGSRSSALGGGKRTGPGQPSV